ncbi:MAG TPA: DUF2264 domain-containing protein [Chitinophagaceae bacterium]|jgi:hypothetical protein|nr:DUF2264 domain-containing protein [Chitinophagaceae bacterium]
MIKRITLLVVGCLFVFNAQSQLKKTTLTDRQLWLSYMDKLARPVMMNIAADKLKEKMPVVLSKRIDNADNRSKVAYLEAFGRTLSGIAPWLNSEDGSKEEVSLRNQYREWAIKGLANAVNPAAKDYLKWDGGQPLVDASFVAFALIRCPWLWQHLDTTVKQQIITIFKTTHSTTPAYNNWILFSGMIEAFFCKYGLDYDPVRIEFAIREFAQHWYVGDGLFSDGMQFHFDYYNSIVIHPYLAAIVETVKNKNRWYQLFALKLDSINKRYAEILERLINTDGSYLVTGRSIVYRGGVFHHLADISLRKNLPISLKPAQVRNALTAVIKKTFESSTTFTADGWLNIGLYGSQPDLADVYITTGSLYICSNIFLALGLPETDEFWSAPAQPWTAVKVWSGQDVPLDHALDLK